MSDSYKKAVNYEDFMKLDLNLRKMHSDCYLNKFPDRVPVILNVKVPEMSALKNCKYINRINRFAFERERVMHPQI
jgi:hypothetical protein